MADLRMPWPHAPTHQLSASGTFFVTAGTYNKLHHFRGAARLEVLQRGLLSVAHEFGWRLEAWAVFSNHYHFVGHSPEEHPNAESLPEMLKTLHSKTAAWVNKLDAGSQRQVWFDYRETRLTFPNSYRARLNYTHQNPVKHGLVPVANRYPWCSAAWFETSATSAQVKALYSFKLDQLQINDEFDPAPEW